MPLAPLLQKVRACRICELDLPLGARPILQLAEGARLWIIGQAPGRKVHESGVPWDDASGARLREWLNIDASDFYDSEKVAIVPMGLCYPGRSEKGGDRPPRPECAPLWHPQLLGYATDKKLTLLVGQYAQRYYLGARRAPSMTETVKAFSDFAPNFFPLPHPSWRSAAWMQRNPWFSRVVLPELREAVHRILR